MDSNNRISWIDLSRMVAIFCVVLCHATESIYSFNEKYISAISMFSKVFMFCCFTLGRIGVPLFLLISGYLLLDRKYDSERTKSFWMNNWLHLLICTWIWFAVYDFYLHFYAKQSIGFLQFLEDMLFIHKVNMGHVWYMPMILGIYILIPFVANVLKSVETSQLIFPVVIFGFFSFVVPSLQVINTVVKPDMPLANQFSLGFSGGTYGLYLIFGFLIKKKCLKKIRLEILVTLGIVSFFAGVAFQIFAYAKGVRYNIWYDSPFILVTSVCLFECLSRIRRIYGYSIVRWISYYSFPVYLIHYMICYSFADRIKALPVMQPVKILIIWLLCFWGALICSWAINKIPKVGKYILYTK